MLVTLPVLYPLLLPERWRVFPTYTEPPSYLTLRLLSVSTFTEPREAGLAMWPRS